VGGLRRAVPAVGLTIFVLALPLPVRGDGTGGTGFSPLPEYLRIASTAPPFSPGASSPGPAPFPRQAPGPIGHGEGFGAQDAAADMRHEPSDFVMSPSDVEGELGGNERPEPLLELGGDFFANAVEEIEKGDGGSHAGLTGRIDKFVRYFQNRGRDRFEVWLARSGKYSDMMRGILAEYGLPGDLFYLALIESGFSPYAYSVARAAGPWQFIKGTARRYGLQVDWWVDERRDFEKATRAAAAYLRDLHGMFDSWPLAAAAYNAGEGKITRAVARYKTEDFSELIRYRYLKPETKDYVPKMLAALSIAKDPERYGFGEVRYEPPLEFDRATVPGATDLSAMGRILDVPLETLRALNPELRRFCTPPSRDEYEMRLPKGSGAVALERMEEIRSEAKVTFVRHTVRRNETLASLSERYQTPVAVLKELNGLRGNSLERTPRIIIPVTGLSAEASVPGRALSPQDLKLAHMRVDEGYRRGGLVRVRRGDTLSHIARRTGVSVRDLMRANGIRDPGMLRAGAVLRIPGPGSAPAPGPPPQARGGGGGPRRRATWSVPGTPFGRSPGTTASPWSASPSATACPPRSC
jgi:membrane-bound lytic murein transglycosylase D